MGMTKEERARRDKLAEQGIGVCYKCKEEKPFSEFAKDKNKAYGINSQCKGCMKKYYEENKERISSRKSEYMKEYAQRPEVKKKKREYNQKPEVKKKIREYKKQYDKKPEVKKRRREYNQRPEVKKRAKEYGQKPEVKKRIREYSQKPEVIERQKQYRRTPEERRRRREYMKEYYKNPENKRKRNKQQKERHKSDPMYRMRKNLSSSFKQGFKQKGWAKDSDTQAVVRCAWEQLILWLGGEPNGKMHIDHVIPQSLAETPDELKLLNHYTNLQLLPAEENLSKSNRYIRKENLNRVLAHHSQPDKLKEIIERSDVEII